MNSMIVEPDVKSAHQTDRRPPGDASSPEVSVVMPCLNEAETLGACIEKSQRALRELNIASEIIVADNGSTDGSQAIAARNSGGDFTDAGLSDHPIEFLSERVGDEATVMRNVQ